MMYGGLWGTVCDDGWSLENTAVLCRQLNFKYPVATLRNDLIGPGSGPVWLDEVTCHGDELSIVNCSYNAWGDDNCDHTEDVVVWCASEWSAKMWFCTVCMKNGDLKQIHSRINSLLLQFDLVWCYQPLNCNTEG